MRRPESLQSELALLERAARAAGAAALPYFRENAETSALITWKAGNSPVSEADFAANAALERILRSERPDYGWISEETVDAPERLGQSAVFIVDPIDGTRAFIAGKSMWAVSVALVVEGQPFAGVVHAPALGETTTAMAGDGAFQNGRRLAALSGRASEPWKVAGPVPLLEGYQRMGVPAFERAKHCPSLACRLVQAATGTVDVALASHGAHEWDVAAADVILAEVGGVLLDQSGDRLTYNRASLRMGVLAAGHPSLVAPWLNRHAE